MDNVEKFINEISKIETIEEIERDLYEKRLADNELELGYEAREQFKKELMARSGMNESQAEEFCLILERGGEPMICGCGEVFDAEDKEKIHTCRVGN